MPLDRKDSSSTWQGSYKFTEVPPDAPWEPSDEADIPLDQPEQEPLAAPTDTSALHLSTHTPAEDESEAISSARSELLSRIGYYSSFFLTPLLFAGLTSLFVLPLVAAGRAKLPPQTLFPLALIILVIALAQGVAIYYAGTNNGLWAVYTVGSFFLFMLVGCFALFGPIAGFIVLLIFIGISIFLSRRYVHPVADEFVHIVRAFGKYSRTLYPGFNILLPWEKVSDYLSTTETIWKTPVQRVQMTHDEDVLLRGSIAYQLQPEGAHLAVTHVKNWEESLHDLFITSLQSIAATFTPEDFIAWHHGMHTQPTHGNAMPLAEGEARWEQVNGLVFQRIRDRVALWGVLINEVRIYDIALAPHKVAVLMDETTVPIAREKAEAAAPQQPAPQSQQAPKQAAQAQSTVQPQQPVPSDVQIPKGLKEDILRKAYAEVKNGNIKEPETIRNLAAQFDAIAKDPELSQSVNFDAARASLNLYAEAERREEEEEANAGTLFTDETKADWTIRRSTDENLMAGG
ncbi:MAG: hypothetical protein NVS4B11_34010 [Ktedonobacteraceae bacterium]